jgi:hemerythrin-like metal-binding protein
LSWYVLEGKIMECKSSSNADFDSLKLGIEVIDQQHFEIFRAYLSLMTAVEKGMGCEQVGVILYKMTVYVREHLKEEERMLRSVEYPDIKPHIQKHRHFQNEVKQLVERYDEVKFSNREECHKTALDTASFICDWFREHINTVDRAYVPHILSKV